MKWSRNFNWPLIKKRDTFNSKPYPLNLIRGWIWKWNLLCQRQTKNIQGKHGEQRLWRVAHQTLKKKGLLSSITDAEGELVTDDLMLKEPIVRKVAKMALGQKS